MYTILYVDDEPGLLEIGKLFLEQGGQFAIDTVTSPPEALALLKGKEYDAIISDYQMPEMDGIEFLKRVRTSGNTIPFILFTGRGREEVVIQALNAGADFYLQKGGEPVSQFTELAHQIRQAVQQRRAEISIRDLERREADIINFLPDATFAIDRSGKIIAWNRAIEEMTGVTAAEMLGKGDYEYAIPFYGHRRPILIDLISEPEEVIAREYGHIVRDKDVLIADTTLPRPMGKHLTLLGKASPLYNREGRVVGAIESIRDITDVKKAEEGLRESEGRFAAFMDHLPVTAFIRDEQSTNLFVNRRMVETFGEHEWIGKSVYEQFPKEAAEKMVEDDRQTIRDGYRNTIEYLVEKSGERKIFETHKFRIDRGDKPPLIGGFAVDITERKLAEDALRESEERYRNVVEDQTEFISRFLPDGTHIFVNEAYCRYFGLKRDEILGHRFRPQIPAGDRERVGVFFASLTPDHPVDVIDHRILMPDGTLRWQRWSDRAIFDPSGTVREFQSVGRDITDEKATEAALQETEEKNKESVEFLQRVITGAREGIIVYDRELKIRLWNRFMEEMTGMKAADVLGRSTLELFPFHQEMGNDILMRQALEGITGESSDFEFVIPATGRKGWAKSIFSPNYDAHGTIIGVIGIVRNITERKRAEEFLRKSETRLRRAEEVGRSGSWEFRLNDDAVDASEGARILYGLEGSRWTISDVQDVPLPEYRPVLDAALKDLIAGRSPYNVEFKIRRQSDGAVRDIHSIAEYDPGRNVVFGVIHDITEQKQVEEALRESEARYRSILNASPDVISITDPDGRIGMVSPSALKMFGIAREEEVLGKPVTGFLVPEDRDRATANIALMHRGIFTGPDEYRALRADGSTFDIEVNGEFIRDAGGQSAGMVFIVRDISRRRQAEELTRTTLERLETLISNLYAGVAMVSEDGIIEHVNQALCDLYHLPDPPGRIRGLTSQELIEKVRDSYASPAGALDRIRELTARGKPVRGYEIAMRDGRTVMVDYIPIIDRDGKRQGRIWHHQDITGRKQAEEALRESEEKYRSTLDALSDAVTVIDRDFNLILANTSVREWLRSLGQSDDILGKPILDAFPFLPPSVLDEYRTVFSTGSIVVTEESSRIGAAEIVTETRKIPIAVHGVTVAVIAVIRDVTQRRQAEEALRQANRKLNLLNTITRHDVTNQLTVLLGYVHLASLNKPDPVVADFLLRIKEAAATIDRQIAFTRAYQELGVLAPAWFALGEIVAKASGTAVPVQFSGTCRAVQVLADPMLERVFFNLFENAVRHGEHVSAITVRCERDPDGLLVIVEDDGVGVRPDEKEKIFSKGYGKNTGFGLFLAREILAITGITIRETGASGRGARFEMLVPRGAFRLPEGKKD